MSSDDDEKPSAGGETFDALLRDIARMEPREPPEKDDLVGATLGHYRVVAKLGRGGMGVVYRAEDARLAREVALKVLPSSVANDVERRKRFLREARSAAAINHPNIATVYEVGEAGGRLFLAMERVDGSTLRARLTEGPLSRSEAVRIARQIALGLSRAHDKGIVHRDLKPENVMLTRENDVKILDFGLAKLREPISDEAARESTLTQEGRVMGTPGYMSPEQATGKTVDARTDLYALGVVLHEMVTGELPGAHGSGRVAPDPGVAAIVSRCLARAPDDRWASAGEVLVALDALDTKGARAPRRRTARKSAAIAVVGTIALGAVALGVGVGSRQRAHPSAPSASASAPEKPRAIGLLDVPPPVTKSPEALAEYRRAMTDLRDAVRRPSISLRRAIALDPEFAAANLRLAFDLWQPASTSVYAEAVRFRANLDARDLELLHAEEPLETSRPANVVEAERRYAALHQRRPLDVEILLRLAQVRRLLDSAAALATYEELRALDPTMAATEHEAGRAARDADDLPAALGHYARCKELSTTAARCLAGIAGVSALKNMCDESLEELGRAAVISPDDSFLRFNIFDATLGAGRSYEQARAALNAERDSMLSLPASEAPMGVGEEEAELALWFGSFVEARTAFARLEEVYAHEGAREAVMSQRIGIAEEIGDGREVISLLKAFAGIRAMRKENWGYDGVLLQAMGRNRVMPPAALAKLRDGWRAQAKSVGVEAEQLWIEYEVAAALTQADAVEALAHGDASAVSPRAGAHTNAELGRALLLANRYADAAFRLDRAAFDCKPIVGDSDSDAILIIRAALDLGRAREGLGDLGGACVAYRRVLDRWGQATPRSVTADAARAAVKRLRCAE